MKRGFKPIIPLTVALLLITGLAYAMEKRKQAKPVDHLQDTIHEEETLQAELLAATEEHQIKLPDNTATSSEKIAKPVNTIEQLETQ